jgi:hypothetical protein
MTATAERVARLAGRFGLDLAELWELLACLHCHRRAVPLADGCWELRHAEGCAAPDDLTGWRVDRLDRATVRVRHIRPGGAR